MMLLNFEAMKAAPMLTRIPNTVAQRPIQR